MIGQNGDLAKAPPEPGQPAAVGGSAGNGRIARAVEGGWAKLRADLIAQKAAYDLSRARVVELGVQNQQIELECKIVIEELNKRVVELEGAEKKAYSMLAIYGVPEKRAKSVANGIEVYATRIRKEFRILRHAEARVVELEATIRDAPCPHINIGGCAPTGCDCWKRKANAKHWRVTNE